MEVVISGLKCDNCTYRDDSVPFSDYESSIGKPCPECGHSLLTQEDYDNCVKLINRVAKVRSILDMLKWLNPFHYWRLIFGDKRETTSLTMVYKNKTKT